MILFLTKDLFFVPVLQSAGARQGVEVISILSLDSPKLAGIESSAVTTCVIDLASVDVSELASLVDKLRSSYAMARVVAFGPHVQTDRLSGATEAGCDQVLTRGQLNSQIDRLMSGWSSPVVGNEG
jgi:hypothetical protein